jgi:hypothetical protein
MTSEVLTAVLLKIYLSGMWHNFRRVSGCEHFEGMPCFHLQGQAIKEVILLGLLDPEYQGTSILHNISATCQATKHHITSQQKTRIFLYTKFYRLLGVTLT